MKKIDEKILNEIARYRSINNYIVEQEAELPPPPADDAMAPPPADAGMAPPPADAAMAPPPADAAATPPTAISGLGAHRGALRPRHQ